MVDVVDRPLAERRVLRERPPDPVPGPSLFSVDSAFPLSARLAPKAHVKQRAPPLLIEKRPPERPIVLRWLQHDHLLVHVALDHLVVPQPRIVHHAHAADRVAAALDHLV